MKSVMLIIAVLSMMMNPFIPEVTQSEFGSQYEYDITLESEDFSSFREIGEKSNVAFTSENITPRYVPYSVYYYPTKYFQDNQSWSGDVMQTCGTTIAAQGCALTSVAMDISLAGKMDNPGEVNVELWKNACPMKWDEVASDYGLILHQEIYSYTDQEARDTIEGILKINETAIVGMTSNNGNHFVLARGYSNDNGADHIYIYDPGSWNDYNDLDYYLLDGYDVYEVIYYVNPEL